MCGKINGDCCCSTGHMKQPRRRLYYCCPKLLRDHCAMQKLSRVRAGKVESKCGIATVLQYLARKLFLMLNAGTKYYGPRSCKKCDPVGGPLLFQARRRRFQASCVKMRDALYRTNGLLSRIKYRNRGIWCGPRVVPVL